MLLAVVAKERSEDRFVKVGAVIENSDGRIIATGYNGLPAGFSLNEQISSNRDLRRPFMIHAEINALSLIRRGEGYRVYCTLHPCSSCINAMVAHGIKEVIYLDSWENLDSSAQSLIDSGILTVKKFSEKLDFAIKI
jgi:dCMP deaminase